ncbi:hypothetical protein EI613_26945 [Azospirillum sp. 412522]|nr:hypothetical protein [Azospirillum sp. 412522]MBY6265530.1 hypothetical protein [Azospirillum sp. 412522]
MSLLPISKPVAEDAPASFVGSTISPALRAAYLDWRRAHTVSALFWKIAADLPCGDEEDATSSFASAADQLEGVLRDRVIGFTAVTDADRMLKMRCLLESDEDALQGFDHGLLPDLIALGQTVAIPEPAVLEHPGSDAELRDTLTAKPAAIIEQAPSDLLRLFTPEEGAEIFALAAGYRAAKETGSASLPDLIESFEAYGLYAAWHGGFEMVAPDYVPGRILTGEERRELGELGRLSAAAVERLDTASSTRREEAREREKQTEAEKKAKQAAADRAKHGPPTAERLIPLLPSFSEEAREATSSILINADMMSTIHSIVDKHAVNLQTHELEELRRFDIATLKDRFEAGTQIILREELDRLIGRRQAGVAP